MRENDERKLDHTTLEAIRIRAVKQVESGARVDDVAASLGLSRAAVFSWVAAYREGGVGALRAKPIAGRPSKLSGAQLRTLYTLMWEPIRDSTSSSLPCGPGSWSVS